MGWNIFEFFKSEGAEIEELPREPAFDDESIERIERSTRRLTISPIDPPSQAKSTSIHKKRTSAKPSRIVSGPMGIKR